MDSELNEIEIVFAQKLASGEPITRRRAFRALRDWIQAESAKQGPFFSCFMYHKSRIAFLYTSRQAHRPLFSSNPPLPGDLLVVIL